MNTEDADAGFMRRALVFAARAVEKQEVPVGAVLVCSGEVFGETGLHQSLSTSTQRVLLPL